ncbi:MAG: hypothetical protein ACPL6D_04410 [Thermodesulfobacteriota bacterium]
MNSNEAHGQLRIKKSPSQEMKRDPFQLPSGVRPLSKIEPVVGVKEKTPSITPEVPPLMVKAILISDKIRLASIDRHIVTVGDKIIDEKVLEIEEGYVVLGKGDKKRTLYLTQSPIRLTVEER